MNNIIYTMDALRDLSAVKKAQLNSIYGLYDLAGYDNPAISRYHLVTRDIYNAYRVYKKNINMAIHFIRLFTYKWSYVFSSVERQILTHVLTTYQYRYIPFEVVEYEHVHKYSLPSLKSCMKNTDTVPYCIKKNPPKYCILDTISTI